MDRKWWGPPYEGGGGAHFLSNGESGAPLGLGKRGIVWGPIEVADGGPLSFCGPNGDFLRVEKKIGDRRG